MSEETDSRIRDYEKTMSERETDGFTITTEDMADMDKAIDTNIARDRAAADPEEEEFLEGDSISVSVKMLGDKENPNQEPLAKDNALGDVTPRAVQAPVDRGYLNDNTVAVSVKMFSDKVKKE